MAFTSMHAAAIRSMVWIDKVGPTCTKLWTTRSSQDPIILFNRMLDPIILFNGMLLSLSLCKKKIILLTSLCPFSCSNIYYINDNLDKRTWTYIFGACCATTVFIPSFHNYRIWSFLGLLMTTCTSWYLTIASLTHGQVVGFFFSIFP